MDPSKDTLKKADIICQEFSAAWQAGQRPKIEEILVQQPADDDGQIFKTLIVTEWNLRQADGQELSVSDFCARFPDRTDEIRKALAEADRQNDSLKFSSTKVVQRDDREDVTLPPDGSGSSKTSADTPIVDRERIGRYAVQKILGQGGFGRVYLAYDDQLERQVAIKVPFIGISTETDTNAANEYLAEARTVAGLDHPNIVPVYDIGSDDELPCYIVSKFIEGMDLFERLNQSKLEYEETAELIAIVAEALHFAHGKKIIHRDIKPGNILMDSKGCPFVADFGLALKEEDFGKDSTVMGTPSYMSPEQARGESNLVDGRSDIFSLGVVFYEMLVGQRPFEGANFVAIIDRIATAETRPPRQLDDRIPKELERICLKAMAKAPADRYTTAHDFSMDLYDFLESLEQKRTKKSAIPASAPVTPETIRSSDVLICSAEIDDEPLTPDDAGWITQFQRNLQVRLSQLLGETVQALSVPLPNGPATIDDDLLQAVDSAKTVISVLSPPFVSSQGCQQLGGTFVSKLQAAGKLWIDSQTRLFQIHKTPVDVDALDTNLKSIFQQTPSYRFFEQDPATERIREFDERFGAEARQKYFERVYDLAHDISALLKVLKNRDDTMMQDADSKVVYLAMCSSDLQDDHDRMRRELIARGHQVLPDQMLPLVADQFDERVTEYLKRSDYAIHAVGNSYGIIPEGASHSIVEIQNRLAAQTASHSKLQRIIWLAGNQEFNDPRQAEFVSKLRQDIEYQRGAEVIHDNLETIKRIVVDKLAPKEPEKVRESTVEFSENAIRVYLICDQVDEAATEPLEDYLFDQGLEVSLPEFDSDEAEAGEIHRQNLIDCDGVIIFYGQVRNSWVDIKLRNVIKANGYGREKPIAARAVYIASPIDRRKQRFKSHLADTILQNDVFEPSLLTGFLESLRQHSGDDS